MFKGQTKCCGPRYGSDLFMLLSYARSSSTHLVIHFTALLTGLEVPSLRPDSALSDSLWGGDIALSFSEHAVPIP